MNAARLSREKTKGTPPMTEAQCDQLLAMLKKHRWPGFCRRLNIVPPEFRSEAPWAYGRLCLRETKSQAFGAENKKMRPLYEHILSMLPDDFPRGRTCV